MLLLETLFVLVFLAGVAMWSIPAALVLAGIAGVLAVERASIRKAEKK